MLLHEKLEQYRIILASQSPRRKSLLEGLDIQFDSIVRDGIEEDFDSTHDKFEIPRALALKKSNHYNDLLTDKTIVITADTIVWLNGTVLNKPENTSEAYEMLSQLSGHTHEVITGVCVRTVQKTEIFHDLSQVVFRKLSSEEIIYYVHQYQPTDKAGAYGIQEWIGYVAIESITGSFYNVMGLPVQKVYESLHRIVE